MKESDPSRAQFFGGTSCTSVKKRLLVPETSAFATPENASCMLGSEAIEVALSPGLLAIDPGLPF